MKKEHKFVGVGIYTGYVESSVVAGTFIACKDDVFYKDPIKLLKNIAYCFSAAYISEYENERRNALYSKYPYSGNRTWIEDDDDRYDDFIQFVSDRLLSDCNSIGEVHTYLFDYGPFDMYRSLSRKGDWLIIYEHGAEIIASIAFGKSFSRRFNDRVLKETVGITTISDYDEIEIEI